MLNNIVDNIRADSIPLHSDYPYQGGETVEVLGILGIGYSILSLSPMKNCVFKVRELTSSSFLMVMFHLEVRSYSCTLVNLNFFARDC